MSKKGGDNKPSKKAKQEKQNKQIEDATFGLKNKNKSKKVQQFINRVEKSVKHSGGGLENTKAKELKKEAKLAKQLEEEQMRQLFNEAIGNQYGVNKKKAASNAAMLGLNTVKKEVSDFLDTLSSDSSDSDSDDGGYRRNQPREIILDDDEDSPQGVEIFREKTIEDLIEEQRAKLAAEGKKGTPVTEESFAVWRAEKLKKKQAEMEARVKAEQTKRKGGKGLCKLPHPLNPSLHLLLSYPSLPFPSSISHTQLFSPERNSSPSTPPSSWMMKLPWIPPMMRSSTRRSSPFASKRRSALKRRPNEPKPNNYDSLKFVKQKSMLARLVKKTRKTEPMLPTTRLASSVG